MAGKRKGKRGRSRSADMPHIGAALVPSAAFAAVPRTPPPPTPPSTGVGLAQATLNSSLVGRIPLPNPDDEPFSDPESSLYDYQQMEEPGYSSVGFGTWPNRKSYLSERERARTPSPGPSRGSRGREHDVEDFQRQGAGQAMYHVLENPDVNQNDIYAVPDKSKKTSRRRSSGAGIDETFVKVQEAELGTSLNGTTRDVRNAMQAVHDLPEFGADETNRMRRSGGHRGSPVMGRGSPMMGRSSQRSSMRKETDNNLSEVNNSSVKTKGQEPVREWMEKNEGSKPLNEDLHMTETHSLSKSGKVTTGHLSTRVTVKERSAAIEMENVQMRDLIEQQNAELRTLRQVASAVREGDTESAASLMFRKQVEDLKDENEVLKQSTHRLNIELSNKQAVQDSHFLSREAREITGLPSKGPVPSWLSSSTSFLPQSSSQNMEYLSNMDASEDESDDMVPPAISKRYLAPLFVAYDDRLREKDRIIEAYQEELHSLKKRAEEIVRENQKIHMGGSGGTLGMTEWQQLQEQAKLVLEENQILMEQIDVQQNKTKEMFDAHMQEVSRLTKKLSVCEAEKIDLDRDLEETRLKYSELRHKHDSLLLSTGGQVAVQDHINTIADIKRSLTEEKEQHFQETERMHNKMRALEDERRTLAVKNTDMVAENKRLHAEIKALHRAVKRAQQKLMVFQKAVEQSESKELTTQEHLANVIKLAEKTAAERDTYAKVAKEQQSESKRAMNKVLAGSVTVGKLEEKLKLYKMKASARLSTVADRLKSQDETFNSQKQEYEREIKYLRLILHEKESLLQNLETDKREVEYDLENMWQAANSENLRMKDTMRKSLRKLREHDGLRDRVEDVDKQELLNISSDEEH